MSSDGRSRRRSLVEEAYNLQVKAGLMASRIPFWIDWILSPSSLFLCVSDFLVRCRDLLYHYALSFFSFSFVHIHVL
jgi:hypothetical protein